MEFYDMTKEGVVIDARCQTEEDRAAWMWWWYFMLSPGDGDFWSFRAMEDWGF